MSAGTRATTSRRRVEHKHSKHAFRYDIEGLRGLAVLLVVMYHSGIPSITGGFVGVDVFFVISGYLITGLLVQEHRRTGRIDFRRFYARRARRLLPAAAVTILGTLAVGMLVYSPLEEARYARTALATALYASNLQFIRDAADYFGPALERNPFLHTWSLAVEEQFYLFWPILLVIGLRLRGRRGRVGLVIAAVSAVSLVACVRYTATSPVWTFFGSPFRAWEFGFGALASLVPATMFGIGKRALRRAGWIGLAAIGVAALWISPATSFPGAAALLPVAGTTLALLAGAAAPDEGAGRLLAIQPLQRLGTLSYSWYLWHWPALVIGAALVPEMTLGIAVFCAVLSLGVAAVVHHAIENPIRFHPRLLPRPGLSLWLALALSIGVVTVSLGLYRLCVELQTRPPLDAIAAVRRDVSRTHDCAVWNAGDWSSECDAALANGAPTVVAFGDSHAAQWLPALTAAGDREGWRIISMTRSACPASDVRVDNARHAAGWDEQCQEWRRESLERIETLRPSLVVMASSREHVQGPERKDRRRRVTPREWEAGTRRVFTELDSAGIRVLYLRDTPRLGFDVVECLSRAAWRDWWRAETCDAGRRVALDEPVYRAEVRAAEGLAGIVVLDLTDLFCDEVRCESRHNDSIIYRDTDHITGDYARGLSHDLKARIERILRSGP